MSLAKLTARLRAHDWMAALIELMIVVVGILIALQVSNWNQDRVERARADTYYRRLHTSLVADRGIIEDTVAFWRQVDGYGRTAIAYLQSGTRADGSNWKTRPTWRCATTPTWH